MITVTNTDKLSYELGEESEFIKGLSHELKEVRVEIKFCDDDAINTLNTQLQNIVKLSEEIAKIINNMEAIKRMDEL